MIVRAPRPSIGRCANEDTNNTETVRTGGVRCVLKFFQNFRGLRGFLTPVYFPLYLYMWRLKIRKLCSNTNLFHSSNAQKNLKCYNNFSQMKSYCTLFNRILYYFFTRLFKLFFFSFVFHFARYFLSSNFFPLLSLSSLFSPSVLSLCSPFSLCSPYQERKK